MTIVEAVSGYLTKSTGEKIDCVLNTESGHWLCELVDDERFLKRPATSAEIAQFNERELERAAAREHQKEVEAEERAANEQRIRERVMQIPPRADGKVYLREVGTEHETCFDTSEEASDFAAWSPEKSYEESPVAVESVAVEPEAVEQL